MIPYVALSKIYSCLKFDDQLNLQRATDQIIQSDPPNFEKIYCPICAVAYFDNNGDCIKDFGAGHFFISKKGLFKILSIFPTFISGKSLFNSIESLKQHVINDHLSKKFLNRTIKPGFLVNFDDQALVELLTLFFEDLHAMQKYKTDWPENFHSSEFKYAWSLTPTMRTICTRALRPIFHFLDLILKSELAFKIPIKVRLTIALIWHHYYDKEIFELRFSQVK